MIYVLMLQLKKSIMELIYYKKIIYKIIKKSEFKNKEKLA